MSGQGTIMTQQLTTMRCTHCNEPVPNTGFDQAQHENVCPNRPQPDAQRERIETCCDCGRVLHEPRLFTFYCDDCIEYKISVIQFNRNSPYGS